MKAWKQVKFKNILENGSISYGIVQPGSHQNINSVPILRVNNLSQNRIDLSNVLKVAKEIEEDYLRTRLEGGELLITVVGSVGRCAIAPKELKGWNVARAIAVGKIKNDYDINFIKYQFYSDDIKFQIYGNINDTVQPTLNLSSLKELSFFLPPLREQRAIAAVLSNLDDKIDLLQRQNATLEAMAEALFRKVFIIEAKDEWKTGELSDICECITEKFYPNIVDYSIKYIGLEHIDKKIIYLSRFGTSTEINSTKFKFHRGDILFGKLRPYFHKVCFAPFDGVCSTDILVIRPKKEGLFLFSLFAFYQCEVVEFATYCSNGTRMPRIDWNTLKTFEISLPDKESLDKFNRMCAHWIDKIEYNRTQIQTLEKLRDALLPKLMSGEVRVSLD